MGMVPVAKSMMRMRMIRTITQMMTIIFTFFHQNFRATFWDVVLKCSDVASKSSVLFRRWSRFSPRAKIRSTFWVIIFLTPSTSLCRFLTRSFPALPLASMSRSAWASQSRTSPSLFPPKAATASLPAYSNFLPASCPSRDSSLSGSCHT